MRKEIELQALLIANNCVRNTYLEDLHAGTFPKSKKGDYSDVKVVTPYGEIPWNEISRISDKEMKKLMIEIVNKLFTFYYHTSFKKIIPKNLWEWMTMTTFALNWNKPKLDKELTGKTK